MSEKKHIEILTTFKLTETQASRIREVSKLIRLTILPVKEASEIPADAWEKAEVIFTGSKVLPQLSQVPKLRWIAFNFAGVEHALSQEVVHQERILATTSSGVIVSQIGEYVLMALLSVGHKLPQMMKLQRETIWPDDGMKSLMPLELRDSTVGIVGYGSIGREVARLLRPFGATVLAAKKNAMQPQDTGYVQEGLGDPQGDLFHRLYPIEALKDMLKECDYVVVTLPLTDETKHLFNAEMFDAMKESAYLVNVGRGLVIDEPAMIAALQEGKFAGAVLDVFEEEPLPKDSPLWSMPNVIISPHVSAASAHLMDNIVGLFVENLQRYMEGQALFNVLDVEKGY